MAVKVLCLSNIGKGLGAMALSSRGIEDKKACLYLICRNLFLSFCFVTFTCAMSVLRYRRNVLTLRTRDKSLGSMSEVSISVLPAMAFVSAVQSLILVWVEGGVMSVSKRSHFAWSGVRGVFTLTRCATAVAMVESRVCVSTVVWLTAERP